MKIVIFKAASCYNIKTDFPYPGASTYRKSCLTPYSQCQCRVSREEHGINSQILGDVGLFIITVTKHSEAMVPHSTFIC